MSLFGLPAVYHVISFRARVFPTILANVAQLTFDDRKQAMEEHVIEFEKDDVLYEQLCQPVGENKGR